MPTLVRWHTSPVTGNPQRRMGNPNPREGEELVIGDFVYAAGKPWSDIADIAYITYIAEFVFTAGTGKPRSNIAIAIAIADIPNIGTVNLIAGTQTSLSTTQEPSTPPGHPHRWQTDDFIAIAHRRHCQLWFCRLH